MKKSIANVFLEIISICPNCGFGMAIENDDYVIEEMIRSGELSSSNCDIEINCDGCNETFLVTDIN